MAILEPGGDNPRGCSAGPAFGTLRRLLLADVARLAEKHSRKKEENPLKPIVCVEARAK